MFNKSKPPGNGGISTSSPTPDLANEIEGRLKDIIKSDGALNLCTANGVTVADECVPVKMKRLKTEITPLVLEDTPNALSLGSPTRIFCPCVASEAPNSSSGAGSRLAGAPPGSEIEAGLICHLEREIGQLGQTGPYNRLMRAVSPLAFLDTHRKPRSA